MLYANSLAVAFGLVWGSYLNVVVYRLPRGLSTAVPGSHCPRCASSIRPWHNVPVLSFLALGARCRDCGGPISWRYPLVEATTGAVFLLGWWRFQAGTVDASSAAIAASVAFAWILGFVLLALALIDLDHRGLPDQLTLPVAVLALALQPLLGWASSVGHALVTATVAWAGLTAASELWRRLHGEPGFGAGDARMLAMLGAAFGSQDLLRTLGLALAGAAGVAIGQWAWDLIGQRLGRFRRSAGRGQGLPFGTFLALAALYVLLLDPAGVGR